MIWLCILKILSFETMPTIFEISMEKGEIILMTGNDN